jgi:hypothetical protein
MKRSIGPLLAALLVLSLEVPVFAQPEVISLTYRLRPGEVLYYQLSRTIQQTTEMGSQRKVDERRMQAREAIRVLDVDSSGAMVVEWLFEDFKPDAALGAQTQLDTPLWLKLRPDGTVLEVQRGEESPEHAVLVLPGRPVAVGESWTWQATREDKTTFTYTLTRIDQAAGERVAVIRAQASGRSSISPNLSDLPPGVMVRAALLVTRGSGEFHWSIDRGRIVRSSEEVTADATIELANADVSVRTRHVIKVTERRDPLANDVVLVAAPVPEQLIVPGSAVGEWTLQARVGDYTGRYGTPIDRGIRSGFHARLFRWDRGPTVLIDPVDADHVLGLEISDRQYRTDKGIGFGSSEGAVLLAHGMTPTKLDMTLPDLGAMRFLIYDDVGVAFAVNMNKSHAVRDGTHAPVGAVDWTIVFAPGDAGKIFQLP